MGLIRKTAHVASGGIVQPHSLKQRQHGSPGRTANKLPVGELAGAYLQNSLDRQAARKAGMSLKAYRKAQAAPFPRVPASGLTPAAASPSADQRRRDQAAIAQARLARGDELSWKEAWAIEHTQPGCCGLHNNR